jgi:hypothetical protein
MDSIRMGQPVSLVWLLEDTICVVQTQPIVLASRNKVCSNPRTGD